jgi:hypothetical protein
MLQIAVVSEAPFLARRIIPIPYPFYVHNHDLLLSSAAPSSLPALGNANKSAESATLNNPEYVTMNNPAAGTWLALINGFEVRTNSDKYEFRAALDGKVVK